MPFCIIWQFSDEGKYCPCYWEQELYKVHPVLHFISKTPCLIIPSPGDMGIELHDSPSPFLSGDHKGEQLHCRTVTATSHPNPAFHHLILSQSEILGFSLLKRDSLIHFFFFGLSKEEKSFAGFLFSLPLSN